MFKSVALIFFAAMILFFPQTSSANSKAYEEKLKAIETSKNACMDKAEGVTSEMLECFGKSYKEYDTLLNESYKHLRTAVEKDTPYYEALRTEQLAWIKLNKAVIDNVYKNGGGGTIDQVIATSAAAKIITNRIELLIYCLTLGGSKPPALAGSFSISSPECL